MTETWNAGNPQLTNQVAADIPDIEENFDYLMASHGYWVDSSESDQGAAGSGNSIKDLVDAIGSSKKTSLFLKHHAADGNTTTYTLNTSETITANIETIVQKGSILDGSGTLTINGPFKAGRYQVFGSSITVAFGVGACNDVYPEWWGENSTPGTTDMTTEIQAAVDSLTSGTVLFSNQTYIISSPIIPETNVHFKGDGTIKLAASSDDDMFDFTGSDTDIKFEGLTFDGNGSNQTGSVSTNIIHATTQVKRLTIRGCKFKNAAYSDIRLNKSLAHEDIIIDNNIFTDFYGPSIVVWGTTRATISNNILDDTGVTPSGNGNGIGTSFTSTDIVISDNVIKLGSTGSSTFGIEVGGGETGTDSSRININGNSIHCGNYTNNGGISVTNCNHVIVDGNDIYQAKSTGSIEVSDTSVVSVTSNLIKDSAATAIAITSDNNTVSVVGNTVSDFDSYGINLSYGTAQSAAYGFNIVGNLFEGGNGTTKHTIYVNGGPATGLNISNNVLYDNPTSSIAIDILVASGDTGTGYTIQGNEIYNHDRWINIGGSGTNANHVITGNSINTCPTAISIGGTGHIFRDNGPDVQDLDAAGAVTVWQGATEIDTTGGAMAITLADGLWTGQIKTMVMTTDGGDATLTVAHHVTSDPEVFTFDDVDETLVLIWTGTEWATVYATATT